MECGGTVLQSLCLIPVDFYFFNYYYYSKVAVSTFPYICLDTELEREIKQQKSYDLKENKRGNVHSLAQGRSVLEGAQSAFFPLFCGLLWAVLMYQRELQNSCRKILFGIYWNYCFWEDVPPGRAPQPQSGEVQANRCALGLQEGRIHFPVARGWFCFVYSTNRAVFWHTAWMLLENRFQFCSVARERSQAKTELPSTICILIRNEKTSLREQRPFILALESSVSSP